MRRFILAILLLMAVVVMKAEKEQSEEVCECVEGEECPCMALAQRVVWKKKVKMAPKKKHVFS